MPLLGSSSSPKKKKPEGSERPSKSATNINMTFRTIGRMGQSMSSLIPGKAKQEETSNDKDLESTPLPTLHIPSERLEAAEKTLLADIQEVRTALDLFLNSRIIEAEKILEPRREFSLYHSLGHSFILSLKSGMTFQHADIEAAIEALKKTIQLADAFRKKEAGWLGNITTWVKGVSVQDVWNMSRLHRHAELVYAESYLLKALLCIVHDESFVSFLREGLHVRSSYNTYKVLQKFLNQVREQALQGKDMSSSNVDDHFTSGISLGVGLFNIVISLLPNSVMKIVEFIGFTSDRTYGMEILENAGGWEEYAGLPLSELPPLQDKTEGMRRQFCDMVLLFYHVILPKLIPISDADTELADRILAYNLKMYPDGVFFLYFSGRQLASRCKLNEAKGQYEKAIHIQKDWKQLQHMCFWELGLISLLSQQWQVSFDYYSTLQQESNWSKAVYYYLQAISLYNLSLSSSDLKEQQKFVKEAGEMMQKVTGAKQKIAGKSIPMEKFVARKARKFISQNNRLLLPDLEAANAFSVFEFMTNKLLFENLQRIDKEIERLSKEKLNHDETLNFYDDLCLCHYLRAIVLRCLVERSPEDGKVTEYKKFHYESIQCVLDNADKIQLDHYIYYFSRYEQARMLIVDKKYQEAEDIVKSIIKISEKGHYGIGAGPHAKNKYSQENAVLFKCHNCITEIKLLSTESLSSSNENLSNE